MVAGAGVMLSMSSGGLPVAGGASPRVLAGPLRVRVDYKVFRAMYRAAQGGYERKMGVVGLAIFLFLLPGLVSEIRSGDLRVNSFIENFWYVAFTLVFGVMGVWFVVSPPVFRRRRIASYFFARRGVRTDGRSRSVWACVTVTVTEFGVEEVEADGRISRLPFCALRRWPTVSHGVVSFIAADRSRDSFNILDGDMAGVNHAFWDGRGMAVPCSALGRPWRLVREVHRLRGPARRRWKRASRLVRRAGRRWCRPDQAVRLRAEADRLVGRERAWCRAGGADCVMGNMRW